MSLLATCRCYQTFGTNFVMVTGTRLSHFLWSTLNCSRSHRSVPHTPLRPDVVSAADILLGSRSAWAFNAQQLQRGRR